jgi:hypothetical protein
MARGIEDARPVATNAPSGATRRRLAAVLVVLASVAGVLALVAGYTRRAVVDSDQFANRATVALQDESVRTLIAERVTDQVVLKHRSELTAARPIIQSVASTAVGSRAFGGLFRASVRDAHRALFHRDRHTLTLTLTDVGAVLAAGVEIVRPPLARDVRPSGRIELLQRDIGDAGAKAARLADRVRLIAWLLLALTVLLVAGALVAAPDRRRTTVQLGVGAAVGGIVTVVALAVLRSVAVGGVEGPDAQEAAGAVWDAFLGDLRTAGWILAGSGAVVAASAASLIRPLAFGEPLRRVSGWVAREPAHPRLRVLRGVALVLAGVLVLTMRDAVVDLVVTVAGVYLVYAGVTAVQRVIYRPPAAGARRAQARRVVPGRRTAGALMAAALVVAAVVTFLGSGGVTTAAPARGACNGHAALCGRSLDDVALAATHNSMAVPLPGWFASEQDHPIAQQLHDGVRGLLIDTYYADRLPDGKLRTRLPSNADLRKKAGEDGLSDQAIDSARRIRDRLRPGEGRRGMYLCHTFCELGGTPLSSVLDDVHDFLVANPEEVLVVVNQDSVTPRDFVSAVDEAGLARLAYRGPVDRAFPTLRRMIDTNQRVVFLAEEKAGAAPWYRLAYHSAMKETPYEFPDTGVLTSSDLRAKSCEPNRGPENAPLFLVNHWVSTDPVPRPGDARTVNAYKPLLARLRACRRIRRHLPNLVAVNFYRQGDLFRVVDALNGF